MGNKEEQKEILGIPDGRIPGVRLWRNPTDSLERHLLPDFEPDLCPPQERFERRKEIFQHLPRPPLPGPCRPQWNSAALFFNLTAAGRPSDYQNTTVQDVRNWLDEGINPSNPIISEFMCNYWRTLSYGHLAFGINTPRASDGTPLIPTVDAPGGNAQDWGGLINACIDANAEAVWRAAGSLTKDGKRWIPSVVLVQHYWTHASAGFGGYERAIGGNTYLIGDFTHITFDLSFFNFSGVPVNTVRDFWNTLCHEYTHNFLEFWDFYGPQGCTGYWDMLGNNSPPGRMSEVCSVNKERICWLSFKQVINGPIFPASDLTLRPYTTSGEAIKVIPDPGHNPYEYFLLEYRKSTGRETWRPDGALTEEGLLILHINERMGVSPVWLMRDAPYFDPEFADFSDNGGTLWTGHDRLNGILFPQGRNNSFTRSSSPSSNFYCGRPSDLSNTNIRVESGLCRFSLEIRGNPRVGWSVSANDRCVAGHFTAESVTGGHELFCRNENSASLLVHRQAQWLVVKRQDNWIGSWNLGPDNYEVVGDFDSDGKDEIYIRSPKWAGILKWRINRFESITVQHDWIDGWNLGRDNWEIAGDFDGDGKDEIYIRSPEWAGVLKLIGTRLRLQSIHHDWIDEWNLGRDNTEFIGRFTQTAKDEIMIRSPEWMGLFYWDSAQNKLRLRKIQHDRIDSWNMGAGDKHVIGDFDGDGKDEIYIRSAKWVGVIKWIGDRFKLLWIRQNDLEHISDPSIKILLQNGDLSYAGRFLPNRDGVLHRNANSVAVLTWESSEMRIRHQMVSPFNGMWNLGSGDKFVLGDFHRLGRDIADPVLDFIHDSLTDIFIYNAWGTGMIGVNHAQWNPDRPDDIRQEIGLTWINRGELLFDT